MFQSKKIFLLVAGAFVCASTHAQKKEFTMKEATLGMYTTLRPESVDQPSWEPSTERFWQVVKDGDDQAWVMNNYTEKRTDTLQTLQQLNDATGLHLETMPQFSWIDRDYVYFIHGQNLEKGLLTKNKFYWSHWYQLPKDAENVTVDKSRNVAYTVKNNLWLLTEDKNAIQVTNEKDSNVICGQEVHREEFGIDKGIFFSPSGNLLAYYRKDQTMVDDYPVIDWSVVPAQNHNIKYPMAGRTSEQVTLRVYNPKTGKTVTMKTGEPKDHYLTCVTWGPKEQYIYIAILNRDQNHLWLNKYDVATGEKVKTLFEETDPKYVHPLHPLSFVPGHDDEFIWWSQRDGYMHLYLYNTNGKLIRKLTDGDWVVNQLIGFNKAKNEVIITAAKESPLERHAYAVSLKNSHVERIDKGPGIHTVMSSDDGNYIFDTYDAAGIPRNSLIRSTDGKFDKLLIKAADPLADYDRPTIKNVTITAADGKTPLYGKLILPTHFDSTKRYPVIVYLYNGPGVQLIHNQFPESGNLWYEYMAEHGYVVFTMDGRGSDNRGLAFEQVTFRHLGTVEMEDQLKGVDYLKSLPFIDSNRMGVHGWSFGGFMTISLMLRHPGVFKCAVAGGPVIDWRMYEVMYTERYMDRPQDNPEGYEQASLLDKVQNLKGNLLVIHGTNDVTVVWQHSIRFLKSCVDHGVQLDYFVYPGHPHNVHGEDRVHLMQKITDYFDEHLK